MRFMLSTLLILMTTGLLVAQEDQDFEKIPTLKDKFKNFESSPKPASQEDESKTKNQNKKIGKYFDQALKNYEDILSGEKASEVSSTQQRIAANKKLKREHLRKLKAARDRLRDVKIAYRRQYLYLKNAHQEKRLSKEQYDNEVKRLGAEYQFKIKSLTKDIKYHEAQVHEISQCLKTLEEKNRINRLMIKPRPKKRKSSNMLENDLERIMQRVYRVESFELQDIFDAR